MLVECEGAFEVFETKFTDVELCQVGVVRRVGGGVYTMSRSRTTQTLSS